MRRNYFLVFLMLLVLFSMSFANLFGMIVPEAKEKLHLSMVMSGLLPFVFFIAYAVVPIPAGWIAEKYGEKFVILSAYFLSFSGAVVFAIYPYYYVYLPSLFFMGAGMSMLQVASNPVLRYSGGEEFYSFYSMLGQLIFGIGSFIAPMLFSYLVLHIDSHEDKNFLINFMALLVPEGMSWISIYWACSLIFILLFILILTTKFPGLSKLEGARPSVNIKKLFSSKIIIFYFLGVFAYIGTEQGISIWMVKFLNEYHGLNSATDGAKVVSLFWGLMTIGGLLFMALVNLLDVRKVLLISILATSISLTLGLFSGTGIAFWSFAFCGFFLAAAYPGIFSLGLNSVQYHHETVTGILCTAMIGGAVIPFIIGCIGDFFGLRAAMSVIYIALAYMFCIAVFAKPLIKNKTIFD